MGSASARGQSRREDARGFLTPVGPGVRPQEPDGSATAAHDRGVGRIASPRSTGSRSKRRSSPRATWNGTLLTEAECRSLIQLYDDDSLLERVIWSGTAWGRRVRVLRETAAALVEELRERLSPGRDRHVGRKTGRDRRFPRDSRPFSNGARPRAEGAHTLDLYGALAFPLQAAVMRPSPGRTTKAASSARGATTARAVGRRGDPGRERRGDPLPEPPAAGPRLTRLPSRERAPRGERVRSRYWDSRAR